MAVTERLRAAASTALFWATTVEPATVRSLPAVMAERGLFEGSKKITANEMTHFEREKTVPYISLCYI